jgi:hypothetical protein
VTSVHHVLVTLHPLVHPGNLVVIVASSIIVAACILVAIVVVMRNMRRRHDEREAARSFVQHHQVEALGGFLDRTKPGDKDSTRPIPPVSEPNLW